LTSDEMPFEVVDQLPLFDMPEADISHHLRVTAPPKNPAIKRTPIKDQRRATEHEMVQWLIRYHNNVSPGNGPRYVCADHVRNAPGFDANRTADFVAVDTWKGGAEIHGFEIKVDRKDWLHELKQPEKSDAFKRYMTRWWLVVPDEDMVRFGELPQGWGLLAIRGKRLGFDVDRLVVVKQAPKLAAEPMPWSLTVPLLRAVQRTARGYSDVV